MILLRNSVAIQTSQPFSLVYSLIGQRAVIPKVTGRARVTVALGQDITIPIMTKLFGIEGNNARKQVTILIEDFHRSESHPSSLLSGCDNPRLAAPASSAASSVPCHPSSPACSANTGYSLPDWDIYTHNSQEATCDKHHLGDPGRETPQQRSNQHQFADTSTGKCRLDHSRCAAAHVHHWATEAPLLADPVLHGPKRVVLSSPVTCCDML